MTGGHIFHLLSIIFFSGVLSDLTMTVSYKDQNQQTTYRQILFSEIILKSFQQCVCNMTSVACIFTYNQGTGKSVRYITNMETKLMPNKDLESQLLSYYICQKVLTTNKLVCVRQRDNGTCPVPGTQQYYISETTCGVKCTGVAWIIDQAMMVHSNVTSYLKVGQCPSPCTMPSSRNIESTTIHDGETQTPNVAVKSTIPSSPHVENIEEDDDDKNSTFIIVGVTAVVVVVIILTIVIVLLWKRYLTELAVRNGTQILNSSSSTSPTGNENSHHLAYSHTSLYNDVFITYDDVNISRSECINKNVNTSSVIEPTYATVNKGGKQPGQRKEDAQFQNGTLLYRSSQTTQREEVAASLPDHVYSRLGQDTKDSTDMYDVLSGPETHVPNSIVAAHPSIVTSKGYSLAQPITE